MVTERTLRSYLRRSINLAVKLESCASPVAQGTKLTLIGFGFLVRNRRLAQAILKLGGQYAYEGRMLLRSMIEIYFNYAWIRLREPERRANRFIRFWPLEKLKIHQELSPSLDESTSRTLEKERARVGHLFRNRNKKGKLNWDKTWASATSLEARLRDVLKSETGSYDGFLYALYRLSSSAIHGGPISLYEIINNAKPLAAKPQPEDNPAAQVGSAFAILFGTIQALAKDASLFRHLQPELGRLQCVANRLESL